MNRRRRLFLSGMISAGIHACVVIAAGPRIDLPQSKPSIRGPLQVTLVARTGGPEPPAENPSAPEPVTPAEDESEAPPIHVANTASATPQEKTGRPQPDKLTTRPIPDRVIASKVGKSGKTPEHTVDKPASRKGRETKRSARARPSKRKSTQGKPLAGAEARKLSANESARAGSRPKAASRRVRTPTPKINPRPRYPGIARRKGLEGTVVLKVRVDTRGWVEACRVHASSGHRVLDTRAADTVRKWTFEPGIKDEKPSAMWVKVPIRFELESPDSPRRGVGERGFRPPKS